MQICEAEGPQKLGGTAPQGPRLGMLRHFPQPPPADPLLSPRGASSVPGGQRRGVPEGAQAGAGAPGRRDPPVPGAGVAAAAGWQHVPAEGPAGRRRASRPPPSANSQAGEKERE